MKLKPGTRVEGTTPELLWAVLILMGISVDLGIKVTITSISDGDHMSGSRHNCGAAFDVRTRHLTGKGKIELYDTLRERLNNEYDVVQEATHIHVEYDPR